MKIIFKNKLLFCIILFFFFLLLASFASYSSERNEKAKFEAVYNSIEMPADFKLLETSYGTDGASGSRSLKKVYKVHGTRETIIRKLEPILNERGYNLTKEINAISTDSDYYDAINPGVYPPIINIRLYPLTPNNGIHGSPNTEVNEVVLNLYQS